MARTVSGSLNGAKQEWGNRGYRLCIAAAGRHLVAAPGQQRSGPSLRRSDETSQFAERIGFQVQRPDRLVSVFEGTVSAQFRSEQSLSDQSWAARTRQDWKWERQDRAAPFFTQRRSGDEAEAEPRPVNQNCRSWALHKSMKNQAIGFQPEG